MRYVFKLLGPLLLAALPAQPGWAGHFTVTPIQVFLTARARTELLEVSNHSPKPIQVQVQGFAWSQTPDGESVLTPSDALVVFPSLLDLPPGTSRKLRVGTLAAPGAREESFRLLVTELPGGEGAQAGQIGMRLRLSIPVFLTPKDARPELALGALTVTDGGRRSASRTSGLPTGAPAPPGSSASWPTGRSRSSASSRPGMCSPARRGTTRGPCPPRPAPSSAAWW